ncbi:MAG: tetratricopeptide repeat protein [Melioribacteraceae bacterium]|nr:tetratricopeptide repeat protein [Melioribacteraceae bacterium]
MKRFLIIISLMAMVFGFTAFQCASTEITSARLYLQQENYDKAKEALLREVENNPKSAEGYYLLGFVYGEEGNVEKMVENFEKSKEISNEFAQEIEENRNYHWADNFNKGVAFFNKGAETTDEDSTKMHFDTAIERFKNAILAQPDSVDTYQNLTYAYLNAGRVDDAIEPLKSLVEKTESADSYSLLGEIYITQGQNKMSEYRTSGSTADSVEAMDIFNSAIKLLEEGRNKFPEDKDILLYLSNAYINADKLDVAKETFRLGVEKDPENQYYQYNYAVLLLEDNSFAEAEKHFKKALEIDPEYTNAVYNLGATYVKWGAQLRETAVKEDREDDTEYLDKFKAALPHLEKYLKLNPEDPAMWELLGRVYANLGMNDESEDAFNKADQYK